jgi:hypothetical protein
MQDKVVRTLVIVVLVLVSGVLILLLMSTLVMAWMMGLGMMTGMMDGMMPADSRAAMSSAGLIFALLALVTIVGVVAALIWALRSDRSG